MIEGVQQVILASLPERKVSRNGQINGYNVAFWLLWYPIQSGIKDELAGGRSSSIGSLIISTNSPLTQLQASTIRKYFEKSWVSSGRDIPGAIEEEVNRVVH